ncbi:hypothetical protein JOE49_002237 [Paenibacillus sp. PvR133]|uniref:hypothetical protein n=1 Tax=Paenibacillus sp. PvR133 TaxID=2806598 RepID=UPI001AE7E5A3|nr:hypothetical protein [Paenibacillus sp. PvR133]MBP1174985.1 hypothetical protein [Paenibacillus sp. PvR133]
MKKQWKLITATLYVGVMMYGSAGIIEAAGIKTSPQMQALTPSNSIQGEADPGRMQSQDCHRQGHAYKHGHGKRPGGWDHHLNEKVAKLLGITPVRLENELGQGKSLSDIAKSKGINEEQLINKLKNEMTVDLKRLVNRKGPITFDRKSGTSNEAQLKR